MAITFYIQSKKNPANIYIRIREGTSIDAKSKTNLRINPENFSKGKIKNVKNPLVADAIIKKEIKVKNDLLNNLQKQLNELNTHVTDLLNNRKDYELINSQWLKEVVTPKKEINSIPSTLVGYFDYYLDFKKTSLRPLTIKKLKVFKNRVINYEKDNRTVYIQNVNKKFGLSMQKWCDDNGYAHNTKVKTLKVIKTICNHSKDSGIATNPELELITKGLKYKKSEHIHLNFKELNQIIKTDIKDERTNNAKDWLIISCYTAQRVSDFLRFTKDDIEILENTKFLDISQEKTEEPVFIPLHEEVIKILNKRNGNFPPIFSNNTESNKTIYNSLIKDVCHLAKINNIVTVSMKNPKTNRHEFIDVPKYKAVSTHIGRRSFATNYYGKINTALLISATGHASEEQFLRYVGKTGTQNALLLAKEMHKISLKEKKTSEQLTKDLRAVR